MSSTFISGTADDESPLVPLASPAAPPGLRKVPRGCDLCRSSHSKCDEFRPCLKCRSRNEQCVDTDTSLKAVQRLKSTINDLQIQLESYQQASGDKRPQLSDRIDVDPFKGHGGRKRHWEGIQVKTTQSPQTQFYGPFSSFYFIARIKPHLETVFQQPYLDDDLQPKSASWAFATPTTLQRGEIEETVGNNGHELSRTDEQYLFGFFWESYHCIYPIINEAGFKHHYASLWDGSAASRKQSALVDIVLAICMQYSAGFVPRSANNRPSSAEVDIDDGAIAGRWYYGRCQSLLAGVTESPSVTTLQCQILSVVYLCNASFKNMAYAMSGLAMRTACVLGFHREPPRQLDHSDRELVKRLWWTLFLVECKTCMKLGRPSFVQLSEVTCTLPSDGNALASQSGPRFAIDGTITWLTYNFQSLKLLSTVRAINIMFNERCSDLLSLNNGQSLYDDGPSLEVAANFLLLSMKGMQTWLQELPDGLKIKRKAGGKPFSTDGSELSVDVLAPSWLQRQRLVLEMLFHNQSMNLYRPFIRFSSFPTGNAPTADRCAVACFDHAIAITCILHQVLVETDILHGWHEAFQWQWNAVLSIMGFVLAYPPASSQSCTSAWQTLEKATAVFVSMGSRQNNFAMAVNAANITRDFCISGRGATQSESVSAPQEPVAGPEGTVAGSSTEMDILEDAGAGVLSEFDDASASTSDRHIDFDNLYTMD